MLLPRAIAASIDVLDPLYPGGIPLRFIEHTKYLPVIFYSAEQLSKEQRLLLEAAISKGMKLDINKVEVIEQQNWPVQNSKQCFVVALGTKSLQVILSDKKKTEVTRGNWVERDCYSIMLTHTLDQVMADPQAKREFWNDLQLVMKKAVTNN